MNSFVQKFKNVFLEEAQELLNSYESDLLKLEKNPENSGIIESAFRSMHTLKGISGMYGFDYVNEITHKLEFIFQGVRDKHQVFTKELFEITFSTIDHLRKLLFDEQLADKSLKKEHAELLSLIDGCCKTKPSFDNILVTSKEQESPDTNKQSLWHILLKTTDAQFYRGISFMNIFKELSGLGYFVIEKIDPIADKINEFWSITLNTTANEDQIRDVFLFIEDDCTIIHVADIPDAAFNKAQKTVTESEEHEISILEAANIDVVTIKEAKSKDEIVPKATKCHELKRIAVDPAKLDHLLFLVSELITINSQLTQAAKYNNFEMLHINLEKIDTLSKNFRNNALELRLVPLSELLLRFQRLIRDLSKQLGKKIDFQTQGDENELDKTTIEQITDPLMHIIRNCIDHGIELPEKRIKIGKPETGIIKISSFHSGGKIIIKIEDDGNGIDLDKVRDKAINLGLLNPNDKIVKKELFNFIFIPGFSTAQSLTSVSGRGVGMDVVKKKIQDLRGEIIVESQQNIGTSFTLVLQQSVSIIDSLLFKIENSFFSIPISDISICSDISYASLEQRKHTSTIPYGDKLIPFVDMRKILGLGGEYPNKIKLVIFKNNERLMAIMVDKIIGEHQAVLKPLEKFLRHQNYLTSASQLGDGNMAFMIDTSEMMKSIERKQLAIDL